MRNFYNSLPKDNDQWEQRTANENKGHWLQTLKLVVHNVSMFFWLVSVILFIGEADTKLVPKKSRETSKTKNIY